MHHRRNRTGIRGAIANRYTSATCMRSLRFAPALLTCSVSDHRACRRHINTLHRRPSMQRRCRLPKTYERADRARRRPSRRCLVALLEPVQVCFSTATVTAAAPSTQLISFPSPSHFVFLLDANFIGRDIEALRHVSFAEGTSLE